MTVGVLQLAQIFHDSARTFLQEHGFALAEDPAARRSPYFATAAVYRTKRGLFLRVGFDPLDGRCAGIYFGRRWGFRRRGGYDGRDSYRLSGPFRSFADLVGISLPDYYELHYGDAFFDDVATILGDLEKALPEVMEKSTINDLIKVEASPFGARTLSARDPRNGDAARFGHLPGARGVVIEATPFRDQTISLADFEPEEPPQDAPWKGSPPRERR